MELLSAVNKMLLKFSIALLLFFFGFVPVQAGAPFLQNIHRTTLENGLEVIVIENATVPLATIDLEVRNGAFTESPEYDGLSHLFEHMFFKANKAIPNQESFLARTHQLGMTFNATTSEEKVSYAFTLLRDSLEAGLAFMKDAATSPLFLPEELEKEKHVVIDEYNRHDSEPISFLNREVGRRLWYEYYSRKNVIGDREVILNVTREKMQTILRKYYIPNNSALLVAGDVEHEQVFALVRRYFADWQKGADPFPHEPFLEAVPYPPALVKNEVVVVEKPVNTITIMLAWQGPSVTINTKDTYTADLFATLMNQNSKFPSILVGSGLFSRVDFSYYTLKYKGPITIIANTTAEKFKQARSALFEEIKYLISPDYFSDEQIEYAKTNIEVDELYEWERPSVFVQSLGFWWSITGGLDYYYDYVENIKKVTREDIEHFVTKYVQDRPYVMGVLLSPEDRQKVGQDL